MIKMFITDNISCVASNFTLILTITMNDIFLDLMVLLNKIILNIIKYSTPFFTSVKLLISLEQHVLISVAF